MKLSKIGADKVSRNCHNVMVIGTDDFFPPTRLEGADKLEFTQDDFTEAIVLSVEEAQELFWLIEGKRADYAKTEFGWVGDDDSLNLHRELVQKEGKLHLKWCELLPKRIEEATKNQNPNESENRPSDSTPKVKFVD